VVASIVDIYIQIKKSCCVYTFYSSYGVVVFNQKLDDILTTKKALIRRHSLT